MGKLEKNTTGKEEVLDEISLQPTFIDESPLEYGRQLNDIDRKDSIGTLHSSGKVDELEQSNICAPQKRFFTVSRLQANAIGSALGYFSAGYQAAVLIVLNVVWSTEYPVSYTSSVESRINDASLYDVLVGVFVFGFVCDFIGRKNGLLLACALNLIGTILNSVAMGANGSLNGQWWFLTISQGLVGVAIGGEFPCGMVNSVEDSDEVNDRRRGIRSSLVTTCVETVGNNVTTIVTIVLLRIFGTNIGHTGNLEPAWRITFAFVAIFLIPVFFIRLKMENSKLYQTSKRSWKIFPFMTFFRMYGLRLLTVSIMWFMLQGLNAGISLFGGKITQQVTGGDLMKVAYYQVVLWAQVIFIFIAAFFMDHLGHRKTVWVGFGLLAVCLFLIAGLYYHLESHPAGYLVLNAFQSGFQKVAYAALSMLTTELFPTQVRAICYGTCLTFGFVGAIVFVHYFLPIAQTFSNLNDGFRADIFIAGGMAAIGLVTSIWVPESGKFSLVEEELKFRNAAYPLLQNETEEGII
eukprot:jgi/Galph1/620/GphlegSOOS_G5329.1